MLRDSVDYLISFTLLSSLSSPIFASPHMRASDHFIAHLLWIHFGGLKTTILYLYISAPIVSSAALLSANSGRVASL